MSEHGAGHRGGRTTIELASAVGGVHCETSTLSVLLRHAGLPLSEPMMFGLGEGLSFIYWDGKNQPLPFLGGRVKPFQLTVNLAARLGVRLIAHETSSARKGWQQVRDRIDAGVPVGLQLDSHDLEYFGTRVHFAGHMVAMYGYDEDHAYLVDTAQQGSAVSTSLESLATARAARGPMAARHRSFTIEAVAPERVRARLVKEIVPAIGSCAESFLAPPIVNLGHRGIRTAAVRVLSWFERVEEPSRDFALIATLMERAGTGGALFRNLYRDFLSESVEMLDDQTAAHLVEQASHRYGEAASLWTSIAEELTKAGDSGDPAHLREASRQLEEVAALETSAMTLLRSLAE